MSQVIVPLATSVDGFIAGRNDGAPAPVPVVDAPGVTHLRYRVVR